MNKFFLFIAFFAILISCSKEEIKEQGYGTYMQDLKLPSGERLGDISGFDFDFSAELYDLDQDGKDEIISRTSDGITSYKYNSESNKFE